MKMTKYVNDNEKGPMLPQPILFNPQGDGGVAPIFGAMPAPHVPLSCQFNILNGNSQLRHPISQDTLTENFKTFANQGTY